MLRVAMLCATSGDFPTVSMCRRQRTIRAWEREDPCEGVDFMPWLAMTLILWCARGPITHNYQPDGAASSMMD